MRKRSAGWVAWGRFLCGREEAFGVASVLSLTGTALLVRPHVYRGATPRDIRNHFQGKGF